MWDRIFDSQGAGSKRGFTEETKPTQLSQEKAKLLRERAQKVLHKNTKVIIKKKTLRLMGLSKEK